MKYRGGHGVRERRVTRREFAGAAGRVFVGVTLGAACHARTPAADGGRLSARPRTGGTTTANGTARLGLGQGRDAVLAVPAKGSGGPLPLLLLLHGAGGSGDGILRRLGAFASDAGVAVLAPDAREGTWDAIRGDFGPDAVFIDQALSRVFETVSVDPARVAIGGFSDGATHALSLGLLNGDLFSRIIAFSPGFFVGRLAHGRPRIFITHGTADQVLPIDRCSRVIVPALKKAGYDVIFRQFDGGHEIPPNLAREGMRLVSEP